MMQSRIGKATFFPTRLLADVALLAMVFTYTGASFGATNALGTAKPGSVPDPAFRCCATRLLRHCRECRPCKECNRISGSISVALIPQRSARATHIASPNHMDASVESICRSGECNNC